MNEIIPSIEKIKKLLKQQNVLRIDKYELARNSIITCQICFQGLLKRNIGK